VFKIKNIILGFDQLKFCLKDIAN